MAKFLRTHDFILPAFSFHPFRLLTFCIRNCAIQRLTIFSSLIWNLDGSAVHVSSVRKGSYSYRVYESYAWEFFYSTIPLSCFGIYQYKVNVHASVFIQNDNGFYIYSVLFSICCCCFNIHKQQFSCSNRLQLSKWYFG